MSEKQFAGPSPEEMAKILKGKSFAKGHGVNSFITLTRWNEKGELVEQRTVPGKSLVKNFLHMLYAHFIATTQAVNNTSGGTSNYASSNYPYLGADGSNDNFGILVGTGTTAPVPANAAMETKIAHGTGAGQLIYGGCSASGAFVPQDQDTVVIITRAFRNYSGGTITIEEIGIVVTEDTTPSLYWLISRDTTTQAMNNGDTVLVAITITTTA